VLPPERKKPTRTLTHQRHTTVVDHTNTDLPSPPIPPSRRPRVHPTPINLPGRTRCRPSRDRPVGHHHRRRNSSDTSHRGLLDSCERVVAPGHGSCVPTAATHIRVDH
jgi:hypothetical protein